MRRYLNEVSDPLTRLALESAIRAAGLPPSQARFLIRARSVAGEEIDRREATFTLIWPFAAWSEAWRDSRHAMTSALAASTTESSPNPQVPRFHAKKPLVEVAK